MTREEINLLLYFETRMVDELGIVNTAKMNEDDFKIAMNWTLEGFIEFVPLEKPKIINEQKLLTHYVVLSYKAWDLAHTERVNRARKGFFDSGLWSYK